jgi:uncharacterized protein (UPF0333 family)
MRAQITLEYLILFVISIFILSFSFFALITIKDHSERTFKLLALKSDSLKIYNAIEDVCALGSGNTRRISINVPINVSAETNIIVFENGEHRIVKGLKCPFFRSNDELLPGNIVIENVDGEIAIENV